MIFALESNQDVDVILRTIGEFGVVAGLLISLLIALCLAMRWTATKLLVPMSEAGIKYLDKQTEATTKSVEALEKLGTLEAEIRDTIQDMRDSHKDPDSTFSTIHTNIGIGILGKAIARVADATNVNVADLITELEGVLRRQKS